MRNLPIVLPILFALAAPEAIAALGRGSGQPPRGREARPPRDVPRPTQLAGSASISGRVIAADTARPVNRARVVITGSGPARSAITDELGTYQVTALPAGNYTVRASKAGFVEGAFGRRRMTGPGTPIQLAEGQRLANIDLPLARGAVIAGRVLDEAGEPLVRTTVQVLRYQYQRGERRLMGAGADQTDDRGQYRVFGLPPGEYVVSATAPGLNGFIRRAIVSPPGGAPAADRAMNNTGYAPTYHPGVVTAAEATPVRVDAGQELRGIDFLLQLVPLATVRGMTTDPRGTVMLVPDERGASPRMQQLRGRVQADGTFVIANVPPGKYVAVGRTDGVAGPSTFAVQPVSVAGEDLTIALTPLRAARLAGAVVFESAGTPPPKSLDALRVTVQPIGATSSLPRRTRPAAVDARGRFVLPDLLPGLYVVQAAGARGWTMKAVYRDGRDATDQPIELREGESASGLTIVFSDRVSSLAGAVLGNSGVPVGGMTVITFPADEKLWLPQTRRIRTARTDQHGAYRMNNLPPGDYLLVVTDDVEQGQWFDPAYLESVREKGVRVTLREGEQKTQDIKGS